MLDGERRHDGTSSSGTTGPGQFFAYDSEQCSAVALTNHRSIGLTLRRAELEVAVGAIIPTVDILAGALNSSGLRPFLATQLALLEQHCEHLSAAERAASLDSTLDLALLTLRTTIGTFATVPPQLRRRGLFTAACHHIQRHFSRPGLDAAEIAHAVGCSRMTLYRICAERNLTVGDAIRQARLRRAAEMLAHLPVTTTIEAVAQACGFLSLRTFYRLFRQQFGMTPDEMRALRPRHDTR